MSDSTQGGGGVERRASPRVSRVVGTATVLARRNQTSLYVVRNLSRSGALLVGEAALGVNEEVNVVLELAQQPAPIVLWALVMRCEESNGSRAIAVAFRDKRR